MSNVRPIMQSTSGASGHECCHAFLCTFSLGLKALQSSTRCVARLAFEALPPRVMKLVAKTDGDVTLLLQVSCYLRTSRSSCHFNPFMKCDPTTNLKPCVVFCFYCEERHWSLGSVAGSTALGAASFVLRPGVADGFCELDHRRPLCTERKCRKEMKRDVKHC